MFGPLCVACTAFVMRDQTNDSAEHPNLWRALNHTVCRKPNDRRRRIAVDDSKKLKGATGRTRHPLADLERGVLTFLSALPNDPTHPENCQALLRTIESKQSNPNDMPWYGTETPLPVGNDAGLLRIDAARLQRSMHDTGVHCAMMKCSVVDVSTFNSGVRTFGNKAGVNLHQALQHAEQIRRSFPDAELELVIDRQGGRTHYRRPLQDFWPEANLKIEDELESASRYRIELGRRTMFITFARQAEQAHLPVALASMTAKYVRELLMLRLNRYFRMELPELKPTAGYVQDGRRFLRDIEPVIERLNLPRAALIRQC